MHFVALEKTFQTMCLDLEFMSAQNVLNLKKTMDYKWVILSKLSRFKLFELNT